MRREKVLCNEGDEIDDIEERGEREEVWYKW